MSFWLSRLSQTPTDNTLAQTSFERHDPDFSKVTEPPSAGARYRGTLRARQPADTLARARRAMTEYGITRLACVTDLDVIGLPVWLAVRPLSRSLSVSQGKGASDDLAAVSALMECVEIAHAETHGLPSATLSVAEYCSLPEAVPLAGLPLRMDCQLTPDALLEVIETRQLHDGRAALLPRAILDLDFSTDFPGSELFVRSSNGLASGNTPTEALVHALCEVIERDSISNWFMAHALCEDTHRSRLRLRTVDDAWCRQQIERIEAAGLAVLVWNATGRVGLPSFVATIIDKSARTPYAQRGSGFGCHVDAAIALSRALNEAAQSRLTAISGSRDDVTWRHYREALPAQSPNNQRWWDSVTAEPQTIDYTQLRDRHSSNSNDLDAILSDIHAALQRIGCSRVLVNDLGRPGIVRDQGLSVVHVTVPGLQMNPRKLQTLVDPACLDPASRKRIDSLPSIEAAA